MKFTPGPWRTCNAIYVFAHEPESEPYQIADCFVDEGVIARAHNLSLEQMQANARLIAAAPALYAACQAVIDECDATFVHTEDMAAEWVAIEKQLRAAIALADKGA